MATKRTAKGEKDQSQQAPGKGGAPPPGKPQEKKAKGGEKEAGPENEEETGTLDIHYNLVSVLYHALQGAALYAEYAEDAEAEGDTELAEFFIEIQEEDSDRAERAKELLLVRLAGSMDEGGGEDEDDDEDEDDEDDEEEEGASAAV